MVRRYGFLVAISMFSQLYNQGPPFSDTVRTRFGWVVTRFEEERWCVLRARPVSHDPAYGLHQQPVSWPARHIARQSHEVALQSAMQ